MRTLRQLFAVIAILLLVGPWFEVFGYSVLTHEAIIDSAWEMNIRPLLLERYPNATRDELHKAHAYVYGGAIVQDLGYYPHGNRYFSDLVHYVRSGEFVEALLRDARDINEYAFALGALAHYAADDYGHKIAVNRAVPLLYPKLERKYGDVVTYEDDRSTHLKTEFGFDVLQVAKGRYAPDGYHDFIGFEISQPLLERAFQETYSIPLNSVFHDLDRVIGSYRYDIDVLIPRATRVAWALKKDDIQRDQPGITRRKFLYNLSRASYRKEWGKNYRSLSFGTRFLAFIISLIPKVGPLSVLKLRMPTPQADTMFMASFNTAFDEYRHLLDEERDGHLTLSNINFDTGMPTQPGAYFMADQAYAHLLDDLAKNHFSVISVGTQSDILAYFQDPHAPIATKKNAKAWERLKMELDQLKSAGLLQSVAPVTDPEEDLE